MLALWARQAPLAALIWCKAAWRARSWLGVGATLPVGLKKPGALDVHSAALDRLVELEWVPPGPGIGSTEPCTQNELTIQSRQPTCPRAG
eukprot:7389701-Prymnesium_polylepis.1